MRKSDQWIASYERTRTDPYTTAKEHLSSRFDLSGLTWSEIREIEIPELGMDLGRSFEALRKSWYAYKMSRREVFPSPDLCLRILKIQKALGLPLSEFPELKRYGDSVDWINKELSVEDAVNDEELSENPELDRQLKREEREAALENLGISESDLEEEW